MSSPLQARRAEEKLGLILRRADLIRARLNSLVWQRATFGILAWIIATGAAVMIAAFYVSPLVFLGATLAFGALLGAGLFGAARTAWRMHVNLERAASVADRRAELKGRLETVVQIARRKAARAAVAPPLWSYLVEDTIAHEDEFEPARIERRRLSPSLYALLGSIALATVAFFLVARARSRAAAASAVQGQITLKLKDLHLRREDPGWGDGLELEADAKTMRRLQDEMADDRGIAGASNPLDRLMSRARRLARNLQNRLTGRNDARPRLRLKLADASNDLAPPGKQPETQAPGPDAADQNGGAAKPDDSAESGQAPAANDNGLSEAPGTPPAKDGEHAPGAASSGGTHQAGHGADSHSRSADQANRDRAGGGAGGASHGSGVAPETLFGARSKERLGNQGFEVAIRALPMQSPRGGGRAYVPPKVQVPLNPEQHPDEPIARAVVPEQDREAIRRVFER
jgi:hypothetical protein